MKLSTEDAASKARHRSWLDSLDARLVAAAFSRIGVSVQNGAAKRSRGVRNR
jgi:hypothetical protein